MLPIGFLPARRLLQRELLGAPERRRHRCTLPLGSNDCERGSSSSNDLSLAYKLEGSVFVAPTGEASMPYALAFSREQGHGKLLATACEEGYVTILDASRSLPHSLTGGSDAMPRAHWLAHQNAIFDIAWAKGDTRLLTSSGDRTVNVWDTNTAQLLASCHGHRGSVKTPCPQPGNEDVFASGAMDGAVMMWDCRAPARLQRHVLSPVWEIQDAHAIRRTSKTPMSSRGRATPDLCTRHSVTAVVFIPYTQLLATAGSGDTCVKLWDLRYAGDPVHTFHTTPVLGAAAAGMASPPPRVPPAVGAVGAMSTPGMAVAAVVTPSAASSAARRHAAAIYATPVNNGGQPLGSFSANARNAPVATFACRGSGPFGVTCMSASAQGSRLLVNCTDSKLYLFNMLGAPTSGPAAVFSGHMTPPGNNAFYVRCALSPDGRHAACGSLDKKAYVWQVDRPEQPPLALEGHDKDVSALAWCHCDPGMLATGSDDSSVKVWKLGWGCPALQDGDRLCEQAAMPAIRSVPSVVDLVSLDSPSASVSLLPAPLPLSIYQPAGAHDRAAGWLNAALGDEIPRLAAEVDPTSLPTTAAPQQPGISAAAAAEVPPVAPPVPPAPSSRSPTGVEPGHRGEGAVLCRELSFSLDPGGALPPVGHTGNSRRLPAAAALAHRGDEGPLVLSPTRSPSNLPLVLRFNDHAAPSSPSRAAEAAVQESSPPMASPSMSAGTSSPSPPSSGTRSPVFSALRGVVHTSHLQQRSAAVSPLMSMLRTGRPRLAQSIPDAGMLSPRKSPAAGDKTADRVLTDSLNLMPHRLELLSALSPALLPMVPPGKVPAVAPTLAAWQLAPPAPPARQPTAAAAATLAATDAAMPGPAPPPWGGSTDDDEDFIEDNKENIPPAEDTLDGEAGRGVAGAGLLVGQDMDGSPQVGGSEHLIASRLEQGRANLHVGAAWDARGGGTEELDEPGSPIRTFPLSGDGPWDNLHQPLLPSRSWAADAVAAAAAGTAEDLTAEDTSPGPPPAPPSATRPAVHAAVMLSPGFLPARAAGAGVGAAAEQEQMANQALGGPQRPSRSAQLLEALMCGSLVSQLRVGAAAASTGAAAGGGSLHVASLPPDAAGLHAAPAVLACPHSSGDGSRSSAGPSAGSPSLIPCTYPQGDDDSRPASVCASSPQVAVDARKANLLNRQRPLQASPGAGAARQTPDGDDAERGSSAKRSRLHPTGAHSLEGAEGREGAGEAGRGGPDFPATAAAVLEPLGCRLSTYLDASSRCACEIAPQPQPVAVIAHVNSVLLKGQRKAKRAAASAKGKGGKGSRAAAAQRGRAGQSGEEEEASEEDQEEGREWMPGIRIIRGPHQDSPHGRERAGLQPADGSPAAAHRKGVKRTAAHAEADECAQEETPRAPAQPQQLIDVPRVKQRTLMQCWGRRED